MFTYTTVEVKESSLIHRSDGAWIPTDPANSDYAEYLRYTAWVDAGNAPEDFWTQPSE